MKKDVKKDITRPFRIVWTDGHYAVWHCESEEHARKRASERGVVESIEEIK